MRHLLLIFMLPSLGCNKSPDAKDKEIAAIRKGEKVAALPDREQAQLVSKPAPAPSMETAQLMVAEAPALAPEPANPIMQQLSRIEHEADIVIDDAQGKGIRDRMLCAGMGMTAFKTPGEFDIPVVSLIRKAVDVPYMDVYKKPNEYVGSAIVAKGEIVEIHNQGNVTMAKLHAGYQQVGYVSWQRSYWVFAKFKTPFVLHNKIEVVGHRAAAAPAGGGYPPIPSIAALAILRPGSVAKLKAAYASAPSLSANK